MTGKHIFYPVVALAVAGIASYAVMNGSDYSPRTEAFNYYEASNGKSWNHAAEYYKLIKGDPITGEIDIQDVFAAERQVEILAKSKTRGALNLSWEELGPDNVGGRTRAFLVDTIRERLYSGGVAGGLWYSDNNGGTWNSINDQAENLIVSCITQAANGDIYYGTGEYFASPGGAVTNSGSIGRGIFKSTNGIDFTQLDSTDPASLTPTGGNSVGDEFAMVNKLIAHPTDGQKIYAATSRGLRVTENGGTSWRKDYLPTTSFASVNDIELMSDGGVVCAQGATIYYSPDGSAPNPTSSFTNITPSPYGPPQVGRVEIATAPSNPNVIYLLAAGSNGKLHSVWVTENKGTDWVKIGSGSTSSPGGAFTFEPFGSNGQGFYDNTVMVHPFNSGELYVGGVENWRWKKVNLDPISGDWTRISFEFPDHPSNPFYVHADKHNITSIPGSNGSGIVWSTDGGNFASLNRGATFFPINKGYNVTQFYSVAFSGTGEVIGGTQDNGSQYIDPAYGRGAQEITGGDGGYAEISQINNNILFTTIYFGALYRTDDRGNIVNTFYSPSLDSILPGSLGSTQNVASFVTPIRLWESFNDPLSPDSVYFKNTTETPLSAGSQVTILSETNRFPFKYILPAQLDTADSILVPDPVQAQLALGLKDAVWLNINPLNTDEPPVWIRIADLSGTVQPMRFTSDGNNMFVGTQQGTLYRITGLSALRKFDETPYLTAPINANITVTQIGSFGRIVNDIDVDPTNNNRVVVALGGYGQTTPSVQLCTNAMTSTSVATTNWTGKQGSGATMLPRMPIYSVIIDKTDGKRVILGTEYGVYSTADLNVLSPVWADENNNFPRVPTYQLRQQILPNNWDNKVLNSGCIYAGTHGRGFWKTCTLGSPDVGISEKSPDETLSTLKVYPNPANSFTQAEVILGSRQELGLRVYDLSGRLVISEDYGTMPAGKHKLQINTSRLAAGNYIISVNGSDFRKAERLSIVR